jgi:hypothetical protein
MQGKIQYNILQYAKGNNKNNARTIQQCINGYNNTVLNGTIVITILSYNNTIVNNETIAYNIL